MKKLVLLSLSILSFRLFAADFSLSIPSGGAGSVTTTPDPVNAPNGTAFEWGFTTLPCDPYPFSWYSGGNQSVKYNKDPNNLDTIYTVMDSQLESDIPGALETIGTLIDNQIPKMGVQDLINGTFVTRVDGQLDPNGYIFHGPAFNHKLKFCKLNAQSPGVYGVYMGSTGNYFIILKKPLASLASCVINSGDALSPSDTPNGTAGSATFVNYQGSLSPNIVAFNTVGGSAPFTFTCFGINPGTSK